MMLSKKCNQCGLIKPLEEFHKDKRNKVDGHQSKCKSCKSEYARQKYLQFNPNAKKYHHLASKEVESSYKLCRKCKQFKMKTEFHKKKEAKDELRSICKTCRKQRQQLYKKKAIDTKKYECDICFKVFSTLLDLILKFYRDRILSDRKIFKESRLLSAFDQE